MDTALALDTAACDRARLARDARFDGVFFTAVRSTGIYCRPVCPAPPPKPRNITYYPTAAAAAAAGYRPCLRCRPELAPQAQQALAGQTVQRALALIHGGFLQEQPVADLATKLGLSARQLQRLFVERLGATPGQIHATHRLLLAKQLLTETTLAVTDVALAAGYNSLRRFNTAFLQGCGMAPTALRRQHQPLAADDGGLVLRLGYRPPLDFPRMLAFLRKRSLPGIELIGEDSYQRVLGTPERPTLLRVTADPKRPELRVPGGWDGFEVGVRAVLGQQVTVAAATTFARRLVDAYGAHLPGMSSDFDRQFPAPEVLAEAPLESIGLPRSRAATVRALATACASGQLDFGPGQALEEFVARCVALPGIGPWTAQYIALRGLGQPDAFPAGDLVLQQVLGHAQGQRLSERATEARSQPWRPWRAYAVLHLWHLSGTFVGEPT